VALFVPRVLRNDACRLLKRVQRNASIARTAPRSNHQSHSTQRLKNTTTLTNKHRNLLRDKKKCPTSASRIGRMIWPPSWWTPYWTHSSTSQSATAACVSCVHAPSLSCAFYTNMPPSGPTMMRLQSSVPGLSATHFASIPTASGRRPSAAPSACRPVAAFANAVQEPPKISFPPNASTPCRGFSILCRIYLYTPVGLV
jgi:hypothetical protein